MVKETNQIIKYIKVVEKQFTMEIENIIKSYGIFRKTVRTNICYIIILLFLFHQGGNVKGRWKLNKLMLYIPYLQISSLSCLS